MASGENRIGRAKKIIAGIFFLNLIIHKVFKIYLADLFDQFKIMEF
jgi:hypothetical protein